MSYLPVFEQLLKGLVCLSFLVFIHELGHFLVAIKAGVKVHTFSIGFGKKLLKYKHKGVEYCISAIPFGGYVAMKGENPDSEESGEDSFAKQPKRVRAAIALGGPLVNIFFAFFLLVFVYMAGMPEPVQKNIIIGDIKANSPAEMAGFLPNDTLELVNGNPIQGWLALDKEIALNLNEPLKVQIKRGEEQKELTLIPAERIEQGTAMGVGYAGWNPKHSVMVGGEPTEGSPSDGVGIQVGDTLLSINGKDIVNSADLIQSVQESKGSEIALVLGNEAGRKEIKLSPRLDKDCVYRIGLPLSAAFVINSMSFGNAIKESWNKGIKYALEPFKFLYKIITGGIKVKAMSGGVGIAQVMGKSMDYGWTYFFWLMAVISMNLGIMNLLPLAVTDGGILMFLTLEWLRGKPLDQSIMVKIQQVFFYLFISLFLYITFQDVNKFKLFAEKPNECIDHR